jgi:hypothetical protein
MEDMIGLALLLLIALVLSIVALAKMAGVKASIEELKRRITNLASGDSRLATQGAQRLVPWRWNYRGWRKSCNDPRPYSLRRFSTRWPGLSLSFS